MEYQKNDSKVIQINQQPSFNMEINGTKISNEKKFNINDFNLSENNLQMIMSLVNHISENTSSEYNVKISKKE